MSFDDLARHMASRDGKTKLAVAPGSADQIVAEIAKADRRMTRRRDLILGPILMVGGLAVLALYLLYIMDATDTTPHPGRPPKGDTIYYSYALPVVAGGAVITGFLQLIRGLRGGSR